MAKRKSAGLKVENAAKRGKSVRIVVEGDAKEVLAVLKGIAKVEMPKMPEGRGVGGFGAGPMAGMGSMGDGWHGYAAPRAEAASLHRPERREEEE